MRVLGRTAFLLFLAAGCGPSFRVGSVENQRALAEARHQHALAVSLAEESAALHREISGSDSVAYSQALQRHAWALAADDATDRALATSQEAIDLEQRVLGEHDSGRALGLLDLATLQFGFGMEAESLETLRRAVALCDPTQPRLNEDPACGRHANYGWSDLYRRLGRYEEAERHLLAAEAIPPFFSSLPLEISGLASMGDFYFEHGNYPKALWYYEKSKLLWTTAHESRVGRDGLVWASKERDVSIHQGEMAHGFSSIAPRCLENMITLAVLTGDEAAAGRLKEEERLRWRHAPPRRTDLMKSIEFEKRTGSDPARLSRLWQTLGFYSFKTNAVAEAMAAYERAMEEAEREWSQHSAFERRFPYETLLDARLLLGDTYLATGRYEDAERQYAAFVHDADRYLNERHRWRLDGRARVADAREQRQALESAESAWRDYLRVAAAIRGTRHADYAWGLSRLASVRRRRNDASEARQLEQQARAVWTEYAKGIKAVRDLPLPAALKPYASLIK